jgi:hypothetical protein
MSRPVRIDLRDGWYHVTARGFERMSKAIVHMQVRVQTDCEMSRILKGVEIAMSNVDSAEKVGGGG